MDCTNNQINMDCTNNGTTNELTNELTSEATNQPTSEPTNQPTIDPTSEPTNDSTNDGFTQVTRRNVDNKDVSTNITLERFKTLLTKDKIQFYDKRGRLSEFDNDGILKRYCETIKEKNKEDDKDKPKYKFTVWMKTYLHLSGDVVIMEWFDGEVKFNTRLNHPDLKNWSGRMYWKGV